MNNYFQISFYFDLRRKKQNGKYPLKLQLYIPSTRTQKFYSTKFDLTKEEYEEIFRANRTPKDLKEIKIEIDLLLAKTISVAKNINPFKIEVFEKRIKVNIGETSKIIFYFKNVIEKNKKEEKYNTATNYISSLKSIEEFQNLKNKNIENLRFENITTDWLNEYEKYMVNSGRSISTVGIYLRPLKAIFNLAIKNEDVSKDLYPFGRNNYIIPSSKKTKKALREKELKTIFFAEPQNIHQEKAKDFWLMSCLSNGINFRDLISLKHSDFEDNKFEFYRTKTNSTSKNNLETIVVYLTPELKNLLHKYETNPNNSIYFFNILSSNDSEEVIVKKTSNFVRFVNQHLKILCKNNNLSEKISTNWARHTFATFGVKKGASLELIREFLGHKNLKTTQHYLNSFEDEDKRIFTEKLFNF